MTNYGAIQTSSHPSPSPPVVDVESPSSHNQCTACAMPRRPWGVMFDIHSMGLPRSVSHASSRFKTNYNYFRTNYEIFLTAFFLRLIKHPVTLIAFTVLVSIYVFLYYLQDDYNEEPVELFCCQISDRMIRIVKCGLGFLTLGVLIVTNATDVIYGWPFVIVYIVYVPILVHTVVRKTEDLFLLNVEAATLTETYWNSLSSYVLFALFNLYLSFG